MVGPRDSGLSRYSTPAARFAAAIKPRDRQTNNPVNGQLLHTLVYIQLTYLIMAERLSLPLLGGEWVRLIR